MSADKVKVVFPLEIHSAGSDRGSTVSSLASSINASICAARFLIFSFTFPHNLPQRGILIGFRTRGYQATLQPVFVALSFSPPRPLELKSENTRLERCNERRVRPLAYSELCTFCHPLKCPKLHGEKKSMLTETGLPCQSLGCIRKKLRHTGKSFSSLYS
jgi:hypothetical protein